MAALEADLVLKEKLGGVQQTFCLMFFVTSTIHYSVIILYF